MVIVFPSLDLMGSDVAASMMTTCPPRVGAPCGAGKL